MGMNKQGMVADITANVSMMVQAGSKREAVMAARILLHEDNIRLLKVKMVNGEGKTRWFRVESVGEIEWNGAEWTGYSSRFMALGKIRLTVDTDVQDEADLQGGPEHTAYQLPRSVVNDYTHWAVPSSSGPVFLCVQSYQLEWKHEVQTAVFSKVG